MLQTFFMVLRFVSTLWHLDSNARRGLLWDITCHILYFLYLLFFTICLFGKVDPVGEVSKVKLQVILNLYEIVTFPPKI